MKRRSAKKLTSRNFENFETGVCGFQNPCILTNDPSMTAWGFAVIDWSGNILETGCIKTVGTPAKKRRIRKGDETVRRTSEINQKLLQLIKRYNVNYILSELPHGSQNASGAVMIGIVTGIIQTISDTLNIGVEWYSEGDVKKFIFNRQSVSKQEMVIKIADEIFNKQTGIWKGIKYIDEAVADALAIYYTATKQSSILKLLRSSNV